MIFLSRIEEILLLAIWKLKDHAYGISIRRQVEKDTGMKWFSGAIYAPLGRLKKNGYVYTQRAQNTTEQGGRPRIYYRLTSLGAEKLSSIQSLYRAMWHNVPDVKKQY
jgi:DNA-binding PadR family transcriptional regulator